MRVLHLASEYPPQKVFGLGRFVRDLAEEQVRQDHEVTVLTNSISGGLHEATAGGVRVMRVDYPPPPKPPLSTGAVMVFNILLLRRALDLGTKQLSQFDVVCSHDWLTTPAAQAICDSFGPPHVCTFHDTVVGKRLGRLDRPTDRFAADVERWAARTATHVTANSAATKDELVKTYGADPGRTSVVPCAIAPDTFRVTDDPVRLAAFRESLLASQELMVLYVGRLDPEKGVDVLVRAFAAAGLAGAKLCIAGKGALLEELKKTAGELGVAERTLFLGYVENPAMAHLYRCADMLVCPSLYEPFGMVALEGMLQGTPAIVSDTGGLAELVENGRTGLVVPPGDVAALADAMRKLEADSQAREKMGAAARESVLEQRTWRIACRRMTEVYSAQKARRERKPPRSERNLFVAGGLRNGRGYSTARFGRRLVAGLKKRQRIATVTTGENDLLPLRAAERSDEDILGALNMAARLLPRAARPPRVIECSHWDGVLAADVLRNLKTRPKVKLHLRKIGSSADGDDAADAFEHDMCMWAAQQADEVVVPDGATVRFLDAVGIRSAGEASPGVGLSTPRIVDEALFRSCFAAPDDALLLTALRVEPPFLGDALLKAADIAARQGHRFRWVVCGEGALLPHLKAISRERRLPVDFTGHLPETTLAALLNAADAVVVPLSSGRYAPLLEEALAFSKPVVAPVRTASRAEDAHRLVHECDFSDPSDVVRAVAEALGLGRRAGQAQGERPAKAAANEHTRAHGPGRDIVLYNDWGIGDELLLSAVAREIRRAHPENRMWIRSRFGFRFPDYCETGEPPASAERVETIYQNPVMYGPSYHAPFPGHLVQQMLDKVALDTGIRVAASDVRPQVKLVGQRADRDPDLVVLHCRPNPRLPSKDWGSERWRELCGLLHARGLKVIQVGAEGDPRLPHAAYCCGVPLANLPDLIAGAGLTICLVGLLMHVAAATGTPAVVIYGGREHPEIDGYPGQVHLCSDPLPCRGRWGCHTAPDTECPKGMRCMEGLTPELVDGMAGTVLAASYERVTA